MRKLLYLFLTCLLLAGCRGNRYYLDKVEALWGVDYDSVQHYLLKVDSASLTQEDALDYYYFRMKASYAYLMAMEKSRLDSMIGTMRERYPKGHERAFYARFFQMVYYYNRLDDKKVTDGLADELRGYIRNKRDSSRWYRYKYLLKFYQDDADSALHYLNEAAKYRLFSEARIYALHGDLCQAKQQGDSAAWYYLKAMELDSSIPIFQLANLVLDFLPQQKDSKKALELLARLRERIKRADIPYYNMIKGDYWLAMHEPDSAMKHYRIATETGNGFIASQAYERMGMMAKARESDKEAFDMYYKAQQVWNNSYFSLANEKETRDFEAMKMLNQLNELKVERQKHVILILGLVLLLMVLLGSSVFYLFHRKRINERNRLMQENVMLKQQEELSSLREKEALMKEKEALLREKDARMREELFKRMQVFEKLTDMEKEKHIQLSDTDWKEIRLMVDSGYDDFTKKLRSRFPMLSEKDINFCCLVKINMSIQSLTDIYCISKNSVSRKKLRLKEKMGIGEGETLDGFLAVF